MTSSLENSAPIRQPRTRPTPSPRNQQIYLDYQTGQRQTDLAKKYKLTQTRISQIIRRVEAWLTAACDRAVGNALCGVPSTQTPDDAARARLQHRVQYDRLNEAGRLAMQHFREPQKIVTHKKGDRDGKQFDETTERLLPPSLQCLKIVVQSSAQITRLQASGGCRVGQAFEESAGPPSLLQNESCDHASHSATGHPHRGSNPHSAIAPLTRENVEAWLTEHHIQAARDHKVDAAFTGAPVISDVVNALLGEPSTGLALDMLANNAGKKVVKRRPYDDQPPRVPPVNGWFYGMHDENGGLVAWLHASQLAGAISPDYPPVSRSAPDSPSDAPTTSINPTSSTSPSTADPPQPATSSALTAVSLQTQFPAPYEPRPFDLNSIQPTFYQKGCSN